MEIVAGVFGRGWLIAAGFAIYYLVMALGFEGSWTPFVVMLVISGIAKWLARSFEDSKRRVAFEASLVAEGMSPQDVGKVGALIQAYTDQRAPEDSVEATHAASMTEENRRKTEERLQIISDYGEFLEHNPINHIPGEIWDVKFLPHNKETILDAICLEIIREKDESLLEALKVSALFLADFQEEVGDKPLSLLSVDLRTLDFDRMNKDDLLVLAKQMAENPSRERHARFRPRVQEDEETILARLAAAEQMRREMPEDKKREVLG